ncbi:MAG: Ldh family oxidoreductase [Rhodospirillales bacterium]
MTTRISAAELTALSNAALTRHGLSEADAETTSRILVDADMMGLPTHGVVRLDPYTARLRNGAADPNARPALDQRAPSLALVDGKDATGPVVAQLALDAAFEMTAETGIAYVGCRTSNHCGALAPYGLQACEKGYVMMCGTGASPTMPPFGGTGAVIGNNPLCMAAPCPEAPHFLLDMAMSVVARGKIRKAIAEGTSIPEGWAVDKDGKPTTDPVAANEGFLIAVGGHKGSGLSMAVDILSDLICGATFLTGIASWTDDITAKQGLGHFFLLIDPARLIGREAYDARMGEFQSIIRGTPPADPARPVLMPGELEQTAMAAARRDGIEINDKLLAEVRTLAGA